METIQLILIVIVAIGLFMLYHTIFRVYYFGFAGIASVIGGCLLLAAVLVAIFFTYIWWFIAIGIIGFVVFTYVKSKSADPA
ncbi:hypothetical protein [Planococcus salinarum]|uniref:hypothetical protein n=1 Tax=Planococcus salinarum TaxID=622695 RepID=UPI000E3C3813|nr:hypothetical protein [Planococcus salinarum]TAA72445.1 hypothetical protein D2909_06730 [Planococcus salinarum]